MDFIGVDVGTSGCKASVISENGLVKRMAQRDYKIIKNELGWAVLSISGIWKSVKEILKEISPFCKNAKAIAVSSLGETMAFLDEKDRLLWDEGITYIDSRNVEVWNKLKNRIPPDKVYEITGKTKPHIASVNQYNYWKENRPKEFDNVRKIFFIDSYIAYMLSGNESFDYSSASNTLFFDINTFQWSLELADSYEIDLSLFPQAVRTGSRNGKIRKNISMELGLSDDIEILVGCHDQISATVGGGAVKPGDALLGEGSTEALNVLLDSKQILKIKKAWLPIEPSVEQGTYFLLLSRFMHGNCIKWFVNNFAVGLKDTFEGQYSEIYDLLNENCPSHSNGVVFLPYLSNTYFSGYREAMGSFIGMDIGTDTYRLYRAVLEGLSCETLSMFSVLEECGIHISEVAASGGATKSSIYMQIKSDITKKKIYTLENSEAGILGLAMISAVEFGCFKNLEEAGKVFSKKKKSFQPEKNMQNVIKNYELLSSSIREAYSKKIYP